MTRIVTEEFKNNTFVSSYCSDNSVFEATGKTAYI